MSESQSVDGVLAPDEEVSYQLTPVRASNAIWIYLVAMFFLISSVLYLRLILDPTVETGMATLAIFLVGVVAAGVVIWYAERIVRRYRYSLTDRRLIEEIDFAKTATNSLPYDELVEVELNQGLFDGLFGTGTISMTTESEEKLTLRWIESGQEVERILQEHIDGDE